ncbi:MAG: hypothetical protein DRR08_20050 [Candidatus Parabeggiatoa sp. nov. 2]|nr:MAG: hypothetical protein B6247_08250 [Beggiatoa sp. 4572_84]RKZ57058.1 MAG: hypothetical protein DRR08_20050 [Gammaproteobacteria bacterium]
MLHFSLELGAMLTLETGRIYFKMTLYSLLAINLFIFQFSFYTNNRLVEPGVTDKALLSQLERVDIPV